MYTLLINYDICRDPEKCGFCQSRLSLDFHKKYKNGLVISERAFEENRLLLCELVNTCEAVILKYNGDDDDKILC